MSSEIGKPTSVITRDNMFAPILGACPSLEPIWSEFLDDWQDEKDLPYTLALSDLARHLVSKLEAGETAEFPATFEVVEQLHNHGDEYVREAIALGLLEDLQNTSIYKTAEPDQFRPYLHAESERRWDRLYAFWDEGRSLSDD